MVITTNTRIRIRKENGIIYNTKPHDTRPQIRQPRKLAQRRAMARLYNMGLATASINLYSNE